MKPNGKGVKLNGRGRRKKPRGTASLVRDGDPPHRDRQRRASRRGVSSVRDRILAVASDLFYRQGYRATGINQVIAESGVAKASFYDHFPSKEDLLLAYISQIAQRESADLRQEVMILPTARERFFGLLGVLIPWFKETNYRGCPFQNVVAEIPQEAPQVHEVVRQYHESIRQLIGELTDDLMKEDPSLAHLDRGGLVDTYLLLLEGAIVTAVAYRDTWPVEKAIEALHAYLARA